MAGGCGSAVFRAHYPERVRYIGRTAGIATADRIWAATVQGPSPMQTLRPTLGANCTLRHAGCEAGLHLRMNTHVR